MHLPDPLKMDPGARAAIAWQAKTVYDIELPELPGWNSSPCERHAEAADARDGAGLEPGCRECGIIPRRVQRTGITWLWFQPRALLADATGMGKTVQVAGLLSLCREAGSLSAVRPALVIARAATLRQWQDELHRMIPSLMVTVVAGDRRERARRLTEVPWEVALCGPEMLVSKAARAHEQLAGFKAGTVIVDDVDAVRNLNKTSRVIAGICGKAGRVVVCTATPLDKKLTQLYDLGSQLLGWQQALGTREEFQRQYVKMEQVWYTPKLKPTRCRWCKDVLLPDYRIRRWVNPEQVSESGQRMPGPCGKRPYARPGDPPSDHFPLSRTTPEPRYTWVERGIEEHMVPYFRERVAPLVLRRVPADADDMSMPAVELCQVPVALGAQQRERYEEVRKGVLTRLDDKGKRISRQEAENLWMRAWQVTSSLANIDKGTSCESAKLDWAVDAITGDMSGEQVVVYCYFRATLEDLSRRLGKAGVPNERIWGEQGAACQDAARRQFDAGIARVMLITDAGGMGLNLQKARRMILVDTPRSAGRVAQLIGRCKRDGSEHQTVYVSQLLSDTPLDQSLAEMVGREAVMQALVLDAGKLADEFSWAEETPERLLTMVTG